VERSSDHAHRRFRRAPTTLRRRNDEILAFAMVETAEAMRNLESIAATPGLDGIYVGPADLTFSLYQGRLTPAFDREEPEMIEMLKTIVAVCKRAVKRAALHCGTAEYAARAIGWGFNMTTVSGDSRLLAAAASGQREPFSRIGEREGRASRSRQGGVLMPHILVAGKLHSSGITLLNSAPILASPMTMSRMFPS
jgi:4-hydroxy-2-oxoheptanedioate aldolase